MSFRRRSQQTERRGGGFVYHRRAAADVEKRANQQGGAFESYIRDDITVYKVKEGTNILRILPPPSRDYEHFAIDVFTHFGVGVEKNTYLCLNKMLDKDCPVCEEHSRVLQSFGGRQMSDADKEELRKYNAGKRSMMYVIDRNEEDKGPQVWPAPWTVDRDIGHHMQDRTTGEILWIDDPESGYDVDFSRQGTGLTTKYVGLQIARRATPLHRDESKVAQWLKFIVDNPLRDILVYREYERIHKALHQTMGGGAKPQEGGETTSDDDDMPTPAEILRMDPEELDDLAAEYDIDVDGVDDDELADFIIGELEEAAAGPPKDFDDEIPF